MISKQKRCDYEDEHGPCTKQSIIWNDNGERSCGEHQEWLARPLRFGPPASPGWKAPK